MITMSAAIAAPSPHVSKVVPLILAFAAGVAAIGFGAAVGLVFVPIVLAALGLRIAARRGRSAKAQIANA